MRRLCRVLAGVLPLLVLAAPLAAQGLAEAEAPASALQVTPAVGSLLPALAAPVEMPADLGREVAAAATKREGTIFMIVGGAAVVTGLIIDEPIVYVPGAILGLWGLYRYLKAGG